MERLDEGLWPLFVSPVAPSMLASAAAMRIASMRILKRVNSQYSCALPVR